MSDQDNNIFAGNQATQPQGAPAAPAVQPTDSFATLLASVKNERGEQKYRDVNEAFNGLKHAQEYIPTLKQELAAKEQALAAAQARQAELEEAYNSMLALTSQRQEPVAQPAAPVFDEKKIAELVAQNMTQQQTAAAQKANVDSVVSTLQSVFGADAEKTFYGKAQELGMSMQEMNALAAKSPKAVLTMLGVAGGSQKQNVAPTTGSINPAAYQPKTDSFVGRNDKSALIGATTEELQSESRNARAMVDELHAAGYTVHDLTDPKMYFKTFGKK